MSDTEHTFRQYYNIPNWVQTPGVFLFVYLIDLFLLALCFALFCFLGGGGGVSQWDRMPLYTHCFIVHKWTFRDFCWFCFLVSWAVTSNLKSRIKVKKSFCRCPPIVPQVMNWVLIRVIECILTFNWVEKKWYK